MTRRFDCPRCSHIHAIANTPHSLRTVAPEGELYCPECGEVWTVAVNPSGVVARRGDEVHAWLVRQKDRQSVWPATELLEELIANYLAHADQRISLEEPLVK